MLQTLSVRSDEKIMWVNFNRPSQKNSINKKLLQELLAVLNAAETCPSNQIIVLAGNEQTFCTGMDFEEIVTNNEEFDASLYMQILQRMSLIPRVIVSCVEGKVMAGGIGFIAASDLVIATPRSQFNLSEALWGLLPACVIPYLIRRVGFQAAYRLTLTTQLINAEEAQKIMLVDIVNENITETLRGLTLRLLHLNQETIKDMKQYFRKMWLINEEMESCAVNEITRLMQSSRVRGHISNFVKEGRLPWESTL